MYDFGLYELNQEENTFSSEHCYVIYSVLYSVYLKSCSSSGFDLSFCFRMRVQSYFPLFFFIPKYDAALKL